MIIRWLGRSAIEIIGEKNILVDPNYQIKPKIDPDIILISHEHDDHFDPEVLRKYPTASVYAPFSVFEEYDIEGNQVDGDYKINNSIEVIDIDCYGARSAVGFYYKGVYHTGDASVFPEPEGDVRILFSACFADHYSDYIDSCQKIKPNLVIPYHYDIDDREGQKSAEGLANKLKENGFNTIIPEPGKEINLY